MSLHSDTLFWFRASKSLLFLLKVACLAGEATNNNFMVFGLTAGLEPTIYRTRDEHANHYATDAVIYIYMAILKLQTEYIYKKKT